jgi:ComF family protein
VDFICPPACFGCKQELEIERVLCKECDLTIQPVMSYNFSVTQKYMMPVYSLGLYQGILQKMIVAKHYKTPADAKALARLMIERSLLPHPTTYDYVIPIPLHWTRYAKRGYNQAEYIAKELSTAYGIGFLPALQRIKRTKLQVQLTAEQRQANLSGAFTLDGRYKGMLAGKRVVLVDDLFTSGATMQSAIAVLRKEKIAHCAIVVAARVL